MYDPEKDPDMLRPDHAMMMIRGLDGRMYAPEDLPPEMAAEVLRGISHQHQCEVVDTINTMRIVLTDLICLLGHAIKRSDAMEIAVLGQAMSAIGSYLDAMGYMPFEVFREQVMAGLSLAMGETSSEEALDKARQAWKDNAPAGTLTEDGWYSAMGTDSQPVDSQPSNTDIRDIFNRLFGGGHDTPQA